MHLKFCGDLRKNTQVISLFVLHFFKKLKYDAKSGYYHLKNESWFNYLCVDMSHISKLLSTL